MANISISDAAFSGFRIVREHPLAVPIWAAAVLVFSLLNILVITSMVGPSFMRMQQAGAEPNQALAALQQMLPVYAVLLPLTLVFYAVFYAAISRAVLHPAEDQFGYLRLGPDELRQFGLGFLYVLVLFGFYILLAIGFVIFTVLVGLVFSAGGKPAPALVGIITLMGFVGMICGLVWFMVRMSLASPLTFASKRIDLFGSWTLTKGHFWPLLWTYLIAFVLLFVVALLGLAITAAFMAVAGGGMGAVGTIFKPDLSSMASSFSPVRLIYMVGSAIFTAMILPVSIAPPAAIYRALRSSTMDENGAPIDSVFS